jgi:hypothetical protein
LRSNDALAERRVVLDDEDITADDLRWNDDRRRAYGCELERGVARAERTMLLRAVGRLWVGRAAFVVTCDYGRFAEPVFGEVSDELRDDMPREEARIGEHAAQRQGCGRSPQESWNPPSHIIYVK